LIVSVDLTGGLDEAREFVFAGQPEAPDMRESVNAWIWDNGTDVGLPRIGIEAVADQWDTHDIQVNIAAGDGRVFNLFGPGQVHDPLGGDGKPRVLGAGPLSFELVEPFRHWRMRLEGAAVESTVQQQIAGEVPNPDRTIPVEVQIDIRAAVPPWENGALLAQAKQVLDEQDEGGLMGGPRFEQLSGATGVVRIGDSEHRLDGGALRVRRQGIRTFGTFRGHAWQSALFPSGRGFGYIVYPPRDDGLPTYNEGYLFDGDGTLIPAWVVDAPWLRRLRPKDEDVAVVLESERGQTRVQGTSLMSNFMVMSGIGANPDWPVLQQAIVRYTWDGETANGMMERSTRSAQIEPS
jgi:hypothetical protein